MTQLLVRRGILMIPTVFFALTAIFVLVRLVPGDAVSLLLDSSQYSQADAEQLREQMGLNDSIPVQYGKFMRQAVTGDFGKSMWTGQPVMKELLVHRLPITLELSAAAVFFGIAIGIPLGVLAALKQDSIIDYVVRSVAIAGLSIPGFWIATLLLVLPVYWWNWAPPFGYESILDEPWTHIQQIFIPASVMSLSLSAVLMRMTRSMMLEVFRQDYVRTAHAKGLSGGIVILRHCLRNGMLPVLSIIGVQVAVLMAGTVVYESIFTLPGVGSYLYEGVTRRDYPVVQGVAVMLTIAVLIVNMLIDISYRIADPRVRI
ncbi:MAG: ABC transporter permease [Hyphomicrobiales bacterium]